MVKDLLPIGSVVMLRDAEKPLMIFGIKQLDTDNSDVEYDYISRRAYRGEFPIFV